MCCSVIVSELPVHAVRGLLCVAACEGRSQAVDDDSDHSSCKQEGQERESGHVIDASSMDHLSGSIGEVEVDDVK